MVPTEIEKDSEAWAKGPLAAALAHFPERKRRFATVSGLEVDRLYLPDEPVVDDYQAKMGFPGEFPFTRGAHPTMYRSRLWTMREYAGYSTGAGVQRALSLSFVAGIDRTLDRVRPAHADRP